MSTKFVCFINPHTNKPILVNPAHVRTASEVDPQKVALVIPWLSRGRRPGPQDHLAPAFTGHALPLRRRKGAVVNPQAHALVAAVVRSSLASAERRRSRRAGGKTCLLGRF